MVLQSELLIESQHCLYCSLKRFIKLDYVKLLPAIIELYVLGYV